MKVSYQKNRILIEPETEFETGVLKNMGDVFKGWHKYAPNSDIYKGLALEPATKKEADNLVPASGAVPANTIDPTKVAATVK